MSYKYRSCAGKRNICIGFLGMIHVKKLTLKYRLCAGKKGTGELFMVKIKSMESYT